ncbi:hypothetical protein ALT785_270128 [Alteromonas infernus]
MCLCPSERSECQQLFVMHYSRHPGCSIRYSSAQGWMLKGKTS